MSYASGLGIVQDGKQAAFWFRKAAEQWNADAQSTLGSMRADGRGLNQDNDQAILGYAKLRNKATNSQESLCSVVRDAVWGDD